MNKKDRIALIKKVLNDYFPDPPIPLQHTDSYTLLIAVILSARCTDARVNQITPALFKRASTPAQMAALPVEEIRSYIQPCGLSPQKSKAIKTLSQILIDRYEGKVPSDRAALEALPGVGQKTASVVLAQAFQTPAFPVDTHILRCARRWGLSQTKNPSQMEKELRKLFPKKEWIRLHLQIIYYARRFCTARGHSIENCPICSQITAN